MLVLVLPLCYLGLKSLIHYCRTIKIKGLYNFILVGFYLSFCTGIKLSFGRCSLYRSLSYFIEFLNFVLVFGFLRTFQNVHDPKCWLFGIRGIPVEIHRPEDSATPHVGQARNKTHLHKNAGVTNSVPKNVSVPCRHGYIYCSRLLSRLFVVCECLRHDCLTRVILRWGGGGGLAASQSCHKTMWLSAVSSRRRATIWRVNRLANRNTTINYRIDFRYVTDWYFSFAGILQTLYSCFFQVIQLLTHENITLSFYS